MTVRNSSSITTTLVETTPPPHRSSKPLVQKNTIVGKGFILVTLLLSMILVSSASAQNNSEPPSLAPLTTYSYEYTTAITIPDDECPTYTEIQINVTDDFTVDDLNIGINLSITRQQDMKIRITSPDGTNITLFDDLGGTNDNFDVTFDDEASSDIGNISGNHDVGTPYYEHSFNPEGGASLSDFDNENAMGNWSFSICDTTSDRIATINRMLLTFDGTSTTPPAPPAPCPTCPAPVATYYLPGQESDIYQAFLDIWNGPSGCDTSKADPSNPVTNFNAITINKDGTHIYFDHWEDGGYEVNPLIPEQLETQIWGDNDITNGIAPGFSTDVFQAGDVVIMNDTFDTANAGTSTYFDGRDKIMTSEYVAATRALWANGSSTLMAGAWELYPTFFWGTDYYVPVGGDLADIVDYEMFSYTAAIITASVDNTTVSLNGTQVDILEEGETLLLGGKDGDALNVNDHIVTSSPSEVHLLTGDVCDDYESRFMTLFPKNSWSSSYYSPSIVVSNTSSRAQDTVLWITNSELTSIDVTVEESDGTTRVFTIASGETQSVTFTQSGAAHAYTTGGEPFQVINTMATGVDDPSDNAAYDWGYSLIPEGFLSSNIIVGWAPGDDPIYTGSNDENSAPIWMTVDFPTGSTSTATSVDVCVDYVGDGGSLTDSGTGYTYDKLLTVGILEQEIIYTDLDNNGVADDTEDQTGTHIWVCDGSDALIAAAYGQDPDTAHWGSPAIDLGTGIPSLPSVSIGKSVQLVNDIHGNGLFDMGDTVKYTVTVENTGTSPISANSVGIADDLPEALSYVLNSTYVDDGSTNAQIADSGTTDFPLDEGYVYPNQINPDNSAIFTYETVIVDNPEGSIENIATATFGSFTPLSMVAFTVQDPGVIGNYVWLDEDGDGDQDAGEDGIANVTVRLFVDPDGIPNNGDETEVATTKTDANGGYLFTDLPPLGYIVKIDTTTLPAGLAENPTYDEDGTLDHETAVSLTAGEGHLTADFGYNWTSTADTNDAGTGADGAIGDRIWIDSNGDGDQDGNEVGLAGVGVALYYDSDSDGIIDALYPSGTTTTDAEGTYIFDELPTGIYDVYVYGDAANEPSVGSAPPATGTAPTGYTQTGDPDHFSLPSSSAFLGAGDNMTTEPILLGPGDVFVNTDFGYQPTSGSDIGDTVFIDNDGDGVVDANDVGIPNVTVALLNSSGDVIATTITNDSGTYLFPDLPAGDYQVWITDTDNVLGELDPISNPTGDSTLDNTGPTVTLDGTTDNLDQDFGYAPPLHTAGDGIIGDTIFIDYDGDNLPDVGEGLENITVTLVNASTSDTVETLTDENGRYYFGDLDPTATYVVSVDVATLPSGLTNSVDPDGGADSSSSVDLSASGGINLDQDFGYIAPTPNTISGTLWEDASIDGTLDAIETARFENVTIVLLDSVGDIVATTTTDASGNFSFAGLPDGTYIVDVTDEDNVLAGHWHADGPNDGVNNNSQVDPYTVSVSGGATDETADFGYYLLGAAIGNFAWIDTIIDGKQEAGEMAVPDIEATLIITFNNGDTATMFTKTDVNGWYQFANLLIDEDHISLGSALAPLAISADPSPSFALTFSPPAANSSDYTITTNDASGISDHEDSDWDGSTPIVTAPVRGYTNTSLTNMSENITSYDVGFISAPTVVKMQNTGVTNNAKLGGSLLTIGGLIGLITLLASGLLLLRFWRRDQSA